MNKYSFCSKKEQTYQIPESMQAQIKLRARHLLISSTLVVVGGIALAGKFTYQKFFPKEEVKENNPTDDSK